jgi:hypothetical protein
MLARAVTKMMDLSQGERIAMGERGHQYILAHQTYEVLADKFLQGLGSVDGRR